MMAAAAPARICPPIAQATVREKIISSDEAAKTMSTILKMMTQPMR